MRLPWRHVLATADPANVQYILSTGESHFVRGQTDVFDVLGEGFFVVEGSEWDRRRRVFCSCLNHKDFTGFSINVMQDKLENALIPILDHVDDSRRGGKNQEAFFDLQDLIHRLIFDITCSLGFGFDAQTLSLEWPDTPVSTAIDIVPEVLAWRCMVPKIVWKLQRWLGIGKERKLKKAQEILHNFAAAHIPGKREEVNEGHLNRCEFAVSYCHQLDLSDKVIKDEILSFFLAGKVTAGAKVNL